MMTSHCRGQNIEVTILTQKLDGIAGSTIFEDYTVGRTDVTSYLKTTSRAEAVAIMADRAPSHGGNPIQFSAGQY